eukprot:14301655-Ditylum_brightwellii.AAC.1
MPCPPPAPNPAELCQLEFLSTGWQVSVTEWLLQVPSNRLVAITVKPFNVALATIPCSDMLTSTSLPAH